MRLWDCSRCLQRHLPAVDSAATNSASFLRARAAAAALELQPMVAAGDAALVQPAGREVRSAGFSCEGSMRPRHGLPPQSALHGGTTGPPDL